MHDHGKSFLYEGTRKNNETALINRSKIMPNCLSHMFSRHIHNFVIKSVDTMRPHSLKKKSIIANLQKV